MKIPLKSITDYSIAGFFGLIVAFVAAGSLYWQIKTITESERPSVVTKSVTESAFKNISIEGKSAYVFDITTGEKLFGKNENEILPLASITKIMTAITAYDMAPKGTIVRIDADALAEYGDSGLLSNERWLLPDLLKYTLVTSSNDGAAAVAAALQNAPRKGNRDFVGEMNENAKNLGLSSLKFNNESGLDVDSEIAGGYGSAKDVALLMRHALIRGGDILEPTRYQVYSSLSEDNITHIAQNTDLLAGKIPGLIGGKTGWSDLAGGNLAVVFDVGLGRPVVAVVLGSSYDGRFTDIDTLVKATYMEYNTNQ